MWERDVGGVVVARRTCAVYTCARNVGKDARFERVALITSRGSGDTVTAVNDSNFTVKLAPGCGAKLSLTMSRYVNQPRWAFPW